MPSLLNPTQIQIAIEQNVNAALAEDIGRGDVTAALIPPEKISRASIYLREDAVIAGQAWFNACFLAIDAEIKIEWQVKEGDFVPAQQVVCYITGPARALLTAERAALNFLQTLSGVATLTRQYVLATQAYSAKIMDTRKTIPGLRIALKYAVSVGGGYNQRIGLFDGILIKENHIAAAGGVTQALHAAQQEVAENPVPIQIEVENLTQLQEALDADARLVLLDNMSLDEMRQAVQMAGAQAELEASGGVDLSTVCAIAATGVHRISIGGLTKHLQAVDFSMRFVE